MYIIYAILGAVMASLGTIFAKLGLKNVDPNVLTSVRAILMAIIVCSSGLLFGKLSSSGLSSISEKQWIYIILSALGGALSWLFFYQALSFGPTISVTLIDKLSIVITAILSVLILSESLSLQSIAGLVLVVLGIVLVSI
jgi:transporter family protein